jgi:glutamate 5-kinase
VRLRAAGHKVVLVSSGAIGVGLQRMAMPARPKSLSGKQASPKIFLLLSNLARDADFFVNPVALRADRKALAAIGQGRLIALWDNLFSQLGQPIAQVLLTRGDISDVRRF